jgi:hypothetical protein
MTDLSWLTTIFCPLLGVVISNARAMAPVKALIVARKNKKLGKSLHFYEVIPMVVTNT